MIYGLCEGDILKVDKVLAEPFQKALKWTAFIIDKNWVEIKKIRDSSKRST